MKFSPVLASWLQVAPLALILVMFFGIPMLADVIVSFFHLKRVEIVPTLSLENYIQLLRSPLTLRLYLHSLVLALVVWAITFCIGFTVAYFLVFHLRSLLWKIALFLLCTVPFLTSNIIRMISWIPFLGRNGIFNKMLITLENRAPTIGLFAVLGFCGGRRLCSPFYAFHDCTYIQFNVAYRQDSHGSCLRCRGRLLAHHHRVDFASFEDRNRPGICVRVYPGNGRLLRRKDYERRTKRFRWIGIGERDCQPTVPTCCG